MPFDQKYGEIAVEQDPGFHEHEPVVLFRAQDKHLVAVLDHYAELCEADGSPPEHLAKVQTSRGSVDGWQQSNQGLVKRPD